jgi:integrase
VTPEPGSTIAIDVRMIEASNVIPITSGRRNGRPAEARRAGKAAGFPFDVHSHMLRHACGYTLANAGHDTRLIQDWLGHRSIASTVRYTKLAAGRFKNLWRD